MNSSLKEATIVLAYTYSFNANIQNTELILLVTKVKKRMISVENSLRNVQDSLRYMKYMLGNRQKMIREVL